jgi:predicted  nucleic acid-binding Zn-ribbon protein
MPGDLRSAVETTLTALDLKDRDAAAAELARQLASEIDDAERAEHFAERALEHVDSEDEELAALIRTLKAKAGHRDAIVRCGQRLEAVLVQLQATPATAGKAGPQAFTGGALTALRGGRAG